MPRPLITRKDTEAAVTARLEAEARAEEERLEKARVKAERRAEQVRLAVERQAEAERLEAERLRQEGLVKAREEADRLRERRRVERRERDDAEARRVASETAKESLAEAIRDIIVRRGDRDEVKIVLFEKPGPLTSAYDNMLIRASKLDGTTLRSMSTDVADGYARVLILDEYTYEFSGRAVLEVLNREIGNYASGYAADNVADAASVLLHHETAHLRNVESMLVIGMGVNSVLVPEDIVRMAKLPNVSIWLAADTGA